MEKAAKDLRDKEPGGAAKHQDQAIKDLKKALDEIEERLKQLRDEMQLEKLARLEARFNEMLARQQKVTVDTITLDKRRPTSGGELRRRDRNTVKKLAEEERVLAELAHQALEIIIEDGTSVVFPRIVAHLREDLQTVAGRLDVRKTGSYTQTVQLDIEQTLKELIDALQKAQQQKKKGGGGGGGGGGGDQPLLPNSAELKLLKSAQLRVNRRTKAVDKERDGKPLDELLQDEINKITALQEEIAVMTLEIIERN